MRFLLAFAICGVVLCLVGIAIVWPYRMLTDEVKVPPPDASLRITSMGCHWRFRYETPRGPVEVDPARTPCANAACRMGFEPGRAAVVPIGKTVRLTVESQAEAPQDLVVPTLGLRVAAVPGATRDSWIKALHEGVYVGSADARCAKDPAAIAIALRAVSAADWTDWLDTVGTSPDR